MKRDPRPAIEPLEARTLLSVSPSVAPLATASLSGQPTAVRAGHHSHPAVLSSTDVTLHLTAGVPFTGKVAFYPSPVLDPPFGLSASINWGDGTVSAGALQYGVQGKAGGYTVIGSHTYNKAGTFKIKTAVSLGPVSQLGQPAAEFPTRIVATITSKAIVAARQGNSSGGVTINETAGQSFTADLGSFNTIAPATGLHAVVNWGDGSTSAGILKSTGIIGIDVIKFDVTGTHKYAQAGTYPIHIVVTRPSVGPAAAAIQLVATIDSTAVVTSAGHLISIVGTISGTFTTPMTIPDIGKTYDFVGTGTAGTLGNVSAKGTVHLPGFIASGRANGTLTLINSQGSVTLTLAGPAEAGFGPFPNTLIYIITQGTGAYAGDTGSGSIAVTLVPAATTAGTNRFTFVIT